jgi:hypothetical protein
MFYTDRGIRLWLNRVKSRAGSTQAQAWLLLREEMHLQ